MKEMKIINEIVKQQFETVQDLDRSSSTMKQTSTAREEVHILTDNRAIEDECH